MRHHYSYHPPLSSRTKPAMLGTVCFSANFLYFSSSGFLIVSKRNFESAENCNIKKVNFNSLQIKFIYALYFLKIQFFLFYVLNKMNYKNIMHQNTLNNYKLILSPFLKKVYIIVFKRRT